MLYPQLLREQTILQVYHIAISVLRESHSQTIARFAGETVPDVIGKDKKVTGHVQWLARSKQSILVILAKKCIAVRASPVDYKHRVIDLSGVVSVRRAQCSVVNTHLWKNFAITESVVFEHRIGFCRAIVPHGLPG